MQFSIERAELESASDPALSEEPDRRVRDAVDDASGRHPRVSPYDRRVRVLRISLVALGGFAAFLPSITVARSAATTAPSAADARAVVQEYVRAFQHGDVRSLLTQLAPGETEVLNGQVVSRGRAQARRYYTNLFHKITTNSFRLTGISVTAGRHQTSVTGRYRFFKTPCKPVIHGAMTFVLSPHAGGTLIDRISTKRASRDLPPTRHCR